MLNGVVIESRTIRQGYFTPPFALVLLINCYYLEWKQPSICPDDVVILLGWVFAVKGF